MIGHALLRQVGAMVMSGHGALIGAIRHEPTIGVCFFILYYAVFNLVFLWSDWRSRR